MVLMFLCMWYASRSYDKISFWKLLVAWVMLSIIGLVGTHLMAVLEGGYWNGRSFFGAVFLVPVLMYPVAQVLKIRYGDIIDICSPAGFCILALLKVKCKIDNCCYGRMISIGEKSFQFPSQIVEGIAAVVLLAVILIMIKKQKWKRLVYCWFLILYGIVRFVLNFFRETTPWIGPLASGTFWSLISIILGAGILYLNIRKQRAAAKN